MGDKRQQNTDTFGRVISIDCSLCTAYEKFWGFEARYRVQIPNIEKGDPKQDSNKTNYAFNYFSLHSF